MITCKQQALITVQEYIQQYQNLFELRGDPIFKLAVNESKLEYDFVQVIPDDANFIATYAKILINSGLKRAVEERLDRMVSEYV